MRLTLAEIRSYPGASTIDVTGKHLPGIAGDTGAGKSTILEVTAFALYGACPWPKDSRGLDELPRTALEDTGMEAS
ncbi:AAA family ATPase [Streptomyces xanthochromogenes]|uniref:AAA family ATPase n=1 Tax=Streptomyces xanthochromogenes TaxID=67384 RepID=UPI001675C12C|nr:AAA family ATPase [Streptomyces xanthochromogenes]